MTLVEKGNGGEENLMKKFTGSASLCTSNLKVNGNLKCNMSLATNVNGNLNCHKSPAASNIKVNGGLKSDVSHDQVTIFDSSLGRVIN